MGMSIEEHIAQLKKLRSFHNGSYGASVKVAIDTMRKYQKVEQLIAMDDENHRRTIKLCELKEVIEDGK